MKHKTSTQRFAMCMASVAIASLAVDAAAQAGAAAGRYPERPIRLIVPNGAGGSTDLVARVIAQKMSDELGQQIVVDNRGGSGGIIGSKIAAEAAPDGYTLMIGTVGNMAISPHLYRKPGYDAIKDFAPISQTATAAYMVLVAAALPAKTLKEFVALAKAKPGALSYASAGAGTGSHLSTELFLSAAGIKILHVPYKGGTAMITAVLADQVQVAFGGIPVSLPQIRAGRVRALAVTTPQRVAVAPDVPTFAESGYPSATATTWTGVLAPAGTPRAIVHRLNAAIRSALQSADVKKRLTAAGAEPVATTPEAFGAYLKEEFVKWGKVLRLTGARVN
jgi:tripartite-type tricarboxylate transporter receptor subunit TctC